MKRWENEPSTGGLRLNLNVEHRTRHRSTSITHPYNSTELFSNQIQYEVLQMNCKIFSCCELRRFHILLAHKNSNHHVEDNSEAQGSGTYACSMAAYNVYKKCSHVILKQFTDVHYVFSSREINCTRTQ